MHPMQLKSVPVGLGSVMFLPNLRIKYFPHQVEVRYGYLS
jgi:hypothetical protein